MLIACVAISSLALSQSFNSPAEALEGVDRSNFFEVQEAMNAYFEQNPEAYGEKLWRRREWFLEPRLYPSGRVENLTVKNMSAYKQYVKSLPQQRATHGQWSFLGPTDSAGGRGQGRLNCIAIHPTNDNIIYVGASNGGIWKSTNGGTTWSNITPDIPLLSIMDIVLDPNNSNIIYALTGDGDPSPGENNSHSQTEISSIGIIRSSNAGSTWYPTGFSFDHPSSVVPNVLVVHPTNGNIQYVGTKSGIFKTTNAWASNTQVLFSNTYDIEFHPTDPMKMYCSGSNWIRRSVDGGDTWLSVSDPDFTQMSSASRVELAVTPDFSTTVYAIAGNWNSGSLVLYRNILEGLDNFWVVQDNTTNIIGAFADYCIAMVVKDTDDRDIFAGGVGSWRSLNSNGTSGWTQINNNVVHADVHDMVFKNGAIYIASDGGLYKSTDDGNTWTDLSPGLAITEIYRIAGTPQNAGLYYIGMQDNGTYRRNGGFVFTEVIGSDGMTCQIDYTNTNRVWGSTQNGNMLRSTNGGNTFTNMSVPGDGSSWITPMEIDKVVPTIVFVGKDSVYRSTSSGAPGTWTYLGSPAGDLNCLETGTSNRNRMYVSDGAQIFRTDNALSNTTPLTWTNIGAGVPNLFITGIAVDPSNSLRVYVSLSGYSDGEKVYFSSNGGASWTNISGSLPNVPANCIVFHDSDANDNSLYLGTDIGVFYRNNTLGDWIYYSNSLPAVNISDLYVNTGSGHIVAGTYGRGLWRSTFYDGCVANLVLGPGSLGGQRFYSTSNSITSSVDHKPDLGTEIHYKAGNYIDLIEGFELNGIGFFEGKIGPCPDIYEDPLSAPFISESQFILTTTRDSLSAPKK